MNCPVCVTERLAVSERSGIEIDYCPKCRGVWLDRGELDKIIERSESYASRQKEDRGHSDTYDRGGKKEYRDYSGEHRHERSRGYDYKDGDYTHRKHHKKESFWGELFDD